MRPTLYPGEEMVATSLRMRAETQALGKKLAARQGFAFSRLLADVFEMYLAEHEEGFEPWLLLDHEGRQEVLDSAA